MNTALDVNFAIRMDFRKFLEVFDETLNVPCSELPEYYVIINKITHLPH